MERGVCGHRSGPVCGTGFIGVLRERGITVRGEGEAIPAGTRWPGACQPGSAAVRTAGPDRQ